MDLLTIVTQATWREFLIELVEKNQMNPWDVDIVQVADSYLAKIREMQALDLRIPANVILASAILLHFKAQALTWEEEEEKKEIELINEEVPELILKGRGARRRRVTLNELINALNEVMKEGRRLPARIVVPRALNLSLSGTDITTRVQEVYKKALSIRDSEGMLLLSDLLNERTPEEIVYNLIPVLHLTQNNKMDFWQDDIFGEIFIKVL